MPWDFVLLYVLLGVIVPWRAAMHVKSLLRQPAVSSDQRLALYASTIALQWAIAGIALWRCLVRGFSYQSLGFTVPNPALAYGVGLALSTLLTIIQVSGLRRLARTPVEQRGAGGLLTSKLLPQNQVEMLVFIAVAATAAICEEFLYRGFLFSSLANLGFRSTVLGVLGSSLLFSMAHLYQGIGGVITTFIVGTGFALVRTWTATLAPCALAHFVMDIIAGTYGTYLLKRRR